MGFTTSEYVSNNLKKTKMTKVAIPVSNGHTSMQFEKSSNFLRYDLSVSNSLVLARHLERGVNNHPELVPERLAKKGVNIVIARWIRKKMAKSLSDNKIFLFVGVSKLEPDELVGDFLEGYLVTDERMCY